MSQWEDCVQAIARSDIEFPVLKVVELAQATLESGRGRSALFASFNNPYGMKYRSEMSVLATSATYTDHAGETDEYCDFANFDDMAKAYWVFIDRPVYQGWRGHAATPEAFLRFIAYAGYIGGPYDGTPASRTQKETYISRVTNLFEEANELLAKHWQGGEPRSDRAASRAAFHIGRAHVYAERGENGVAPLQEAAKHLDEADDPDLSAYAAQVRALTTPWQNDAILVEDLELALESVPTGNDDYSNPAISGYLVGRVYGHCELGAGTTGQASLVNDVDLAAERAILLAGEHRCAWEEGAIRHEFGQVTKRIERFGIEKLNLLKPAIDVLMRNYWTQLQ